MKYFRTVPSLPESFNVTSAPTVKISSYEQVIKDYLIKYPGTTVIREKAVSILREYLNRSGIIIQDKFYVRAGSSKRIELKLYNDIVYELVVSVSGTCIGKCDISLRLVDEQNKLVLIKSSSGSSFISGRYNYLRITFKLYPLETGGTYYLLLDNSYSVITSKNVYVTVRAYYPSYAFDDEYFKIFAVGHWISNSIRYISDPFIENEYIATPDETLRVKAGDCDDFAVLLAVLYRSIGLNAMVGLIDTDGDNKIDHATALVYLNKDTLDVLNGISKWASVLGVEVEIISYFDKDNGILLIVDPAMATDKDNPWHVPHRPYRLIKTINP